MRVQKILPLFFVSLALTACGGSSGGGGFKSSSSKAVSSSSNAVNSSVSTTSSTATTSSAVSVSSAASSLSSSVASETSSSSSSSVIQSSSSSSDSSTPTVVIIDMTAGWRGNASGGTTSPDISYNADGLTFTVAGAGEGAVFDFFKPTQLENAVVEMVVNVSSEFKLSGANLQIFAQIKNDWGKGEWNCLSNNAELTADTDITLTCIIDEPDDKFNQEANDIQMGIQATGTPSGAVTIKSAKITLAPPGSSSSSSSFSYSSYDASVASLKDLKAAEDLEVFPIGVAVGNKTDSPGTNIVTNTQEQALVEKHFSQMTAGNIMKMKYLHPKNDGTAGDYDFTEADEFVAYAKSKGISIHAHTMFWHSDYQVPEFMKNWTGTSEEFLTVVDDHVTTLVNHFAASGNVKSWDVVNEALTDDTPSDYRQSPFYIASGNSPEFIERAFKAARAANADVELYYNDYSTENNGAKTDMLITMIDDLQAKNTPITGVGFQMHLYLDFPSIANIKAAMQKVVAKNLKVKITELDVSINNPFSNGWSLSTAAPYDGLAQKKRYCEIVEAYKATVPEKLRGGITVWGTTDASTWLDSFYRDQGLTNGQAVSWPLLFTPQYGDKPALRGFADALKGEACTDL